MENRRLLIAALLSTLVLIGWNYMMMGLRPPEESLPGPDSFEAPAAEPPPERPAPAALSEPSDVPDRSDASEPLIDFGADTVAAAAESSVVVETETVRAEFTNLGAQLVSFRLKRHLTLAGEPVELIRPRGRDPFPFALVAGGAESPSLHPLNKALFEWHREVAEDGSPVVRFRHKSELGTAEKVFRWTPERLLAVTATVPGESDWGFVFGPGLRVLEEDEDPEGRFLQRLASYKTADASQTIAPGKLDEPLELGGRGLRWVGLEDNFFLAAAIPVNGGLGRVLLEPVRQRAELRPDEHRFVPLDAQVGEEGSSREILMLLMADGPRMELLTYLGAKQYRRLAALPYGLDETVRWGAYIGLLARPLYFALEWIHERIVANYGWAIVLVTVLIRLLFFPLTYKSQESMAKMQELNPRIQAIRNKYRGKLKDRQGRPNVEAQKQLNDEIMAVYRGAGVNPVSGCFPILLQMPVFFAFFRLLSTAVELRGASWILWIHDLSMKDPYLVLPLLMGATSLGMQQMMPQSPEPMQRRMMQMMPIVFTVFALYFPAGLVLYWLTNNLLSMAQQAAMNKLKQRKAGGREARSEA